MWNSRYQQTEYLFGTAPNAWLAAHEPLLQPGQKVLCVADGEGRNSVWLAQRGMQVDAFDISAVGVEKARALAAQSGVAVNFQVCDCDSFAFADAAYDVVAAIFIQFADPAMRERLFANMVRTLRPGGYLLLQGYTPKQLEYKTGGPPELDHLYTEDLLRQQFRSMEILELALYEAELKEGARHSGMSALVGMVARKAE